MTEREQEIESLLAGQVLYIGLAEYRRRLAEARTAIVTALAKQKAAPVVRSYPTEYRAGMAEAVAEEARARKVLSDLEWGAGHDIEKQHDQMGLSVEQSNAIIIQLIRANECHLCGAQLDWCRDCGAYSLCRTCGSACDVCVLPNPAD